MQPATSPLGDQVTTRTGWEVVDHSPTDDRAVTIGSNFMVGNGYLGYRGTRPEHGSEHFVACVVSDTYDLADGVWRELCTVPNGLFAQILLDGEPLEFDPGRPAEIELACRRGEVTSNWHASTGAGRSATVSLRRFAGLHQLHLLRQQVSVVPHTDATIEFRAGVDLAVWSLNGDHLPHHTATARPEGWSVRCATGDRSIEIGVVSRTSIVDRPDVARSEHTEGHRRLHRMAVRVAAGDAATLDSIMIVVSSNDLAHGTGCLPDTDDPLGAATAIADAATAGDYRSDLAESSQHWAEFWDVADVVIEGDLEAQAALRFSTMHHRFATPAHSDRLPIGARGLSCQAYQGAAFWDQEMFNLPAYLFTAPEIARRLLVYRWRTLDGARRKAARLGYRGAYYAWISGDTGDELCPDYFFEDVLTGRPIRNHFNVWQMHVSPDVAITTWRYWEVTGDLDFLADHGAEILFEVARFLHSFVRYDEVRGRYELIRLLGPDEWHENVDNDAYTNHVSRLALEAATAAHEVLAAQNPARLDALRAELALTEDELLAWSRVAARLAHPVADPTTRLIEQFDGFFHLEDARPDELRERLLHPDEYWGWPNGIAVHTQVSKQPAVVQLFAVDADAFGLEVQRANYDYYEPRCAHGSSLSHSVHATVAARLAGFDRAYLEHAHESFLRTATLDLSASHHANVGGTFIGGMHTAANAGAYSTAVFGFGGLDAHDGILTITPRLPASWTRLGYQVVFRGQRLAVDAAHQQVTVTAAGDNSDSVPVRCVGQDVRDLAPGEVWTVAAGA